MAKLLADSFDFYSVAADLLASGGIWSSGTGGTPSATTRFGIGKSWSGLNGESATALLDATSTSTVFLHFAMRQGASSGSIAAYLSDGTGTLTVIEFDISGTVGAITVRSSFGGTALATFANAYSAAIWNHYQIKIVIHPTAGEVHIRMNGATSDTFSATGLNTKGAGAGNAATKFTLTVPGGSNSGFFDDLFVNDDSGSINNGFLGDIRAYSSSPNAAGSSTNFTPQPVTNSLSTTTGTTTSHASTETWYSLGATAAYDGAITSVTLKLAASLTGNLNVAVYDNTNSSGPGNNLGTATQVVNPAAGLVTVTFGTPVSLVAGQSYRIAVQTSAAASFDGGGLSSGNGKQTGTTYGTFTTNPSIGTINNNMYITINQTPNNYSSVSELVQDGDTSYNFSSNVGDIDFYDIADLPSSPPTVNYVQVRGFMKKSDTGARSGQIGASSGGTTSFASPVALATNYQMQRLGLDTDPNTSAAWTAAAVNALQVGFKVQA